MKITHSKHSASGSRDTLIALVIYISLCFGCVLSMIWILNWIWVWWMERLYWDLHSPLLVVLFSLTQLDSDIVRVESSRVEWGHIERVLKLNQFNWYITRLWFFADKKYLWCALVASIAHHWKACLCFSLYRFFLLAFNFFFHLISKTWWSGFDVFFIFLPWLEVIFFYFVDGCERHKWIISV